MKRLLLRLAVLAVVGLHSALGQTCVPACPSGFVCSTMGGVSNGMCKPAGASFNEACSANTPCMMGLVCAGGVCSFPTSDSGSGSGSGSSPSIPTLPPSFDFDTEDCSPACAQGKSCLFGKCVDTVAITQCTPACDLTKGHVCLFGSCQDVSKNGQAGFLLGACVNGGCSATGLECMQNMCMPSGLAQFVPKCTTNAQCGGLLRCDVTSGQCVEWEAAPLDCGGKCGANQACYFGNCISKPAERSCSPACKAEWGQTCHPQLGVCVANTTSSVRCADCGAFNSMGSGGCLAGAPFLGVAPTCVAGSCQVDNLFSQCGAGSFCRATARGPRCQPCEGDCSQLRRALGNDLDADAFLTLLQAAGISAKGSLNVLDAAATAALVTGGLLKLQPGSVIDIDSSAAAQTQTLLLDAATAAAARVAESMRLDRVQVSSPHNRLLLAQDVQLATRALEVNAGGVLTLALPYTGAAVLNMSELAINGQLNIVGGEVNARGARLNFPPTAAGAKASGAGALVQLSSDAKVEVSGHAGAADWALSDGAEVATSDATPFVHAGSMYGTDGDVTVHGDATLAGRTIEPRLDVEAGATLRLDTTRGSGAQRLGTVRLFPEGGRTSTLEIVGGTGGGANLYMQQLSRCPADALVRYHVTGSARDAVNAGMTLFNYGAKTWDRFSHTGTDSNYACRIQVCGTVGACVSVTNPLDARNDASSGASARRLLADEAEVQLTATWEPTRLSVSGNGKQQSGGGNSAAAIAAQPLLLLALAFAAVVALLRM